MKVAADGTTYEFDENRFLNVEFIAIERVTGMTAVQWQNGINNGSAMAVTALIWILRRRAGEPTLQFDDVSFLMDSVNLNPDGEEVPKDSPESENPPTTPIDTSSPSSNDSDSVPGS